MKWILNAFWWFVGLLILAGTAYGFYLMHENGFSTSMVILIAVYVLTSTFSIILFSQKRHNSAKLSWLLVMIVLPIFGHIIFFAFGQRFKYRKSHEEYLKNNLFEYEDYKQPVNKTILDKGSNLVKRGIYNSDFKILKNGVDAYKEIFAELRKAKKYILIQQYIIHEGEIWDELKEIIIAKSKEGVEIKIIVDDFGRWALPWYEIKSLQKMGIEILIFGKVSFPFISSKNGYRTHRKMFIIDGTLAFIGGMNIGDEYANLSKTFGRWIDLQSRVEGEIIKSLILLFADDWRILAKKNLEVEKYLKFIKKAEGSKAVLIEDSPEILEQIISHSIASWILNAKKSIVLTTPYFVPTTTIFNALETASKSGVDITIIIPGRVDKSSVKNVTYHWAELLRKHGVKFIKTDNQLIHSKIGLFDNKYAYFGTANIDMRSCYSQFEYILLAEGKVVKEISQTIEEYKKTSIELKEKDFKRGWLRRKVIRIYSLLLSPVM